MFLIYKLKYLWSNLNFFKENIYQIKNINAKINYQINFKDKSKSGYKIISRLKLRRS